MIRLRLIAEFANADTMEQAELILDNFREAVLPELNYGITLYRDQPERIGPAFRCLYGVPPSGARCELERGHAGRCCDEQ
jgi:hypothetical protein